MNKKTLFIIVTFVVVVAAIAGLSWYIFSHERQLAGQTPQGSVTTPVVAPSSGGTPSSTTGTGASNDPQTQVEAMLNAFAQSMQNVYLYDATSTAAAQIQQNYTPFVSSDILASWEADPVKAPGRSAATSRPDHLTIQNIQQASDGSFDVQANVIFVTPNGSFQTGETLYLKVRNQNGAWMITGVVNEVPLPNAQ